MVWGHLLIRFRHSKPSMSNDLEPSLQLKTNHVQPCPIIKNWAKWKPARLSHYVPANFWSILAPSAFLVEIISRLQHGLHHSSVAENKNGELGWTWWIHSPMFRTTKLYVFWSKSSAPRIDSYPPSKTKYIQIPKFDSSPYNCSVFHPWQHDALYQLQQSLYVELCNSHPAKQCIQERLKRGSSCELQTSHPRETIHWRVV